MTQSAFALILHKPHFYYKICPLPGTKYPGKLKAECRPSQSGTISIIFHISTVDRLKRFLKSRRKVFCFHFKQQEYYFQHILEVPKVQITVKNVNLSHVIQKIIIKKNTSSYNPTLITVYMMT